MPTAQDLTRLARLVSNRSFRLILLPTEACNFRCTYCYEDFALGRMPREVVEGVKALMRRRAPSLEQLTLSWFGGEPLVARDIVLELSAEAAELARSHPGLRYEAGMSTNAYLLTPQLFSELCAVGVRDYQVSLDGPAPVHDRARVRVDGGATFSRIWQHVLAMRDSPEAVSVLVRIHYDARTIDALEPLVDDLRRELLPDQRFSFRFQRLERLGGPQDQLIQPLPESEVRPRVEALERRLYGERERPQAEEPYVCYAARPNALVIRSDGTVAKCTVALNDARNHIGRLQADGTLALRPERLPAWLRGLETLEPEALACPLYNLPAAPRPLEAAAPGEAAQG